MNSFSEPLRRHAVTIGLSLLLVLGVAYYVLGYLPAREEYLRSRYFRVMSRIGENLQEKERAYGKRVDAMRREIEYRARREKLVKNRYTFRSTPEEGEYTLVSDTLRQKWRRQNLNTPAFEQLLSLPKPDKNRRVGELVGVRWLAARQRVEFQYAFGEQRTIVSSASIPDFVRDLLRPDVFRHFLVVGPADTNRTPLNQLYYSSFPTPTDIQLSKDPKAKGPGWLRDTSGIMATRQAALPINGESYQLFVQPLRLREGTTWLLVGAVPTAEFRDEQRALPNNLLEVALAAILLGLLALPYLKIVLMNARERLNHADVVLCGLTLVFGTTFLILLSLSPVAKYDIEPDLLDTQLRRLSGAVELALRQELRAVQVTLRTAEDSLRSEAARLRLIRQEALHSALRKQYQNPTTAPPDNYVPAAALPLQAVGLRQPPRTWQRQTDRIQWLNWQGEALIFVDSLPTRFNPSLRDRDYLRQTAAGDLWTLPPELPCKKVAAATAPMLTDGYSAADSLAKTNALFRLASVVRYGRQGDKAAVFVRPSGQVLTPDKGMQLATKADTSRLQSVLSMYTTQLRSLTAPVLPPGYSFCLMDAQGEVQFHSDAHLSLSENMFQDAEPTELLRTALLTQATAQGIIQYQGHHQRICVRQLGSWPLYLVTMADLRVVQARQMQTLSFAATLLGGVGLAHLLFVGLYVLVLPRRHRMLDLRYSLRRLWPRPEREDIYWRLVAMLVGGALLLVLFANLTETTAQLFLLLLLPVYAFWFGFQQLQLPTDQPSGALARVRKLVISTLVVYNCLALYWAGPRWTELTSWQWEALKPLCCIVAYQVALRALLWNVTKYLSEPHQKQLAVRLRGGPRVLLQQVLHLIIRPSPPPETVVGSPRPRPYHWFKRAYAFLLLTWIVVLSVLPAIYCYHLAYRVERELQVHYAHLQLDQQLRAAYSSADRQHLNAAERRLAKAYLPFFFGTRYDSSAAPNTLNNRYTQKYRQLVHWLHPAFDTLAQAPRSTLPTGPLAALLATGYAPHEIEHNCLVTYLPRPAGHYARLTSFVSDLAWGRHWYMPQPVAQDEPKVSYWVRWLRQVGLLLLLGASLYMLLWVLARRVFNLDLLSLKNLVRQTAGAQHSPLAATSTHQYLINPLDGTFPDPGFFNLSVLHLNCRQLPPQPAGEQVLAIGGKWLAAAQQTGIRTVALEHFDYRPHDPDLTRAKIEILEELLAKLPRRLRVVVVSRVHPALFADCGHTREHCPTKKQHQQVWALGDRLLDALADFTFAYEPLHPAPLLRPDHPWRAPAGREALQPVLTKEENNFREQVRQFLKGKETLEDVLAAETQHYVLLRWFVKVECDALPSLHALEPELEKFLLDSAEHGRAPSEEDVILAVQRRAQLQLRQLWETLSPHERYLLYDLAQDGLVNGRDSLIINDLLQRGLLVYDQLGLRIVNESFRSFILVGLPQEQALRIEREARQEAQSERAWNRRSFPIFLLLSAAGLFIFVTQRSALNEVQAFLTAILSIAPLAYRFLSFSSLSLTTPSTATKS